MGEVSTEERVVGTTKAFPPPHVSINEPQGRPTEQDVKQSYDSVSFTLTADGRRAAADWQETGGG